MDEHHANDATKDAAAKAADAVGGIAADARNALDQGKAKVQGLQNAAGEALQQAKSAAQDLGGQAQDLARRARDQAEAAADTVYQQGTRAGDYLSRNVEANPLVALLIAGAVGYGLAYLIHRG